MPRHTFSIAGFVLIVVLVFTQSAQAYIDPGTGSFILQLLVGSLLASLLALKMFWAQVKGFLAYVFHRKGPKNPDADVDQEAKGTET